MKIKPGCSQKDYIDFLTFHGKKFNFSYILYTIFWIFIFCLCLIITFGTGSRIQGVLITIILIIFIIYRFARPKFIINKELESDKLDNDDNANTFSFYDKSFDVSNKEGTFSYKYFMIYRVFEVCDFYYLYMTKENAFIVSKHAFSLGNQKDFSKFIKSKCRSKYKIDNQLNPKSH